MAGAQGNALQIKQPLDVEGLAFFRSLIRASTFSFQFHCIEATLAD